MSSAQGPDSGLDQTDQQRVPSRPRVSVVITSYNRAEFLIQAIESVIQQTYRDFELIVVDDGSTDDSRQLIRAHTTLRYVFQENQGVGAARNSGLRVARGEYVVFLDEDDRLLATALEVGVRALNANPEVALVWGQAQRISADGSPLPTREKPWVRREHYKALLANHFILSPGTVMYRRGVLDSVGGFSTSLRVGEDYDLHLRIARTHAFFCHNEKVLEYRMHGGNISRNASVMLSSTLALLRSQYPHIRHDKDLVRAYMTGRRAWKAQFGGGVVDQILADVRHPWNTRGRLYGSVKVLLRYYPQGVLHLAKRAAASAFQTGSRWRSGPDA